MARNHGIWSYVRPTRYLEGLGRYVRFCLKDAVTITHVKNNDLFAGHQNSMVLGVFLGWIYAISVYFKAVVEINGVEVLTPKRKRH